MPATQITLGCSMATTVGPRSGRAQDSPTSVHGVHRCARVCVYCLAGILLRLLAFGPLASSGEKQEGLGVEGQGLQGTVRPLASVSLWRNSRWLLMERSPLCWLQEHKQGKSPPGQTCPPPSCSQPRGPNSPTQADPFRSRCRRWDLSEPSTPYS